MNKKEIKRQSTRMLAEKSIIRDEEKHRIQFAAMNSIKEVLKSLETNLCGLDDEAVSVSRTKYGTNEETHEKKKSLPKRLAGAFVNPFTAILFCLAVVSTITDILLPYFSLLGNTAADFDCLTLVIILAMIFIS